MSGPDGVGNSGVDKTGGPDRSTSASGPDRTETDAIAADAVGAPDAAAQAEARTIADQQGLTVYQGPEEKGTLEAVGDWVADTGIGYAQGAANTVLGAAELVNGVTNAGLGAVGIDYRFSTDMQIQPKSAAQANAQNAIAVGEVLAGGYGLYKSAPRIAQTLDDAGNWIASRAKGRPRNTVFNGTSVGDLRARSPHATGWSPSRKNRSPSGPRQWRSQGSTFRKTSPTSGPASARSMVSGSRSTDEPMAPTTARCIRSRARVCTNSTAGPSRRFRPCASTALTAPNSISTTWA